MFLKFRRRRKKYQTRLDANSLDLYTPHKYQEEFRQHIDSGKRYVFFIGGRRSGKTLCGSWEFVRYILNHPEPPHLSWIVAPTYKVARTVQRYFLDNPIVRATLVSCDRRDQIYELSIPITQDDKIIGERREVVEIRTAREPDALRGAGVKIALVDEAASLSKESFDVLQPVLLDSNAVMLATTTPKARNWLFAEYLARQNDPNFALVKCRTEDNPHISPEATEQLRARYPKRMAAQELDADFVGASGLVYTTTDEMFIDNYQGHMQDTVIIAGCDFGFRDPFACIWIAYDMRTGYYTILDEYYQARKTFDDNLRAIKAHPLMRRTTRIWCDPHEPDNIARMRKEGLPATPAVSKDIATGIDVVQTLFDARRLYVLKRCKNTVWELGTYAYPYEDDDEGRTKNFNDKPVDYANHACDAIRYALQSDMTINRHRKTAGEREIKLAYVRLNSLFSRLNNALNSDWEDGIPSWADN